VVDHGRESTIGLDSAACPGSSRVSASATTILFAVLCAGAGTMVVELAAVRLLAPWFGASTGVWTNVIGVILLALAVGYVCGARLSVSGSPDRRLGAMLLGAAGWALLLPWLASWVARWFMPTGLALDEAAGLMLWGSLATSLLLFAPVAGLLGCGCPLAVEALQVGSGGHAGTAGGRVLGVSTLGSLLGTFGTTHWLLPDWGLRGTFELAAACLALAGLLLLVRSGVLSRAPQVAALCFVALGLGLRSLGQAPTPGAGEGWSLLEQRQSAYQRLAVIESEDGQRRHLVANEVLDSFQSVWQPATGLLGGGQYYDYFALPAWWARAKQDWRVLVLGFGAGTAVRVLEGALPDGVTLSCIGVEIDPVVVELGERYFEMQRAAPDRIVLSGVDARASLQRIAEPQDLVIVDCYANNMEIPAHLCSVEFFEQALQVTALGGFLAVNAAGFGLDDPVVAALTATLAQAAGQPVLAVRIPFSRNCMLFARKGQAAPHPDDPNWAVPGQVGEALLPFLELPSAWRLVTPGSGVGPVLTDESNPMQRLQRDSVRAGRARWLVEP